MAKRISSLQTGESVTLRFHGSKKLGNETHDNAAAFVEIRETGDDAVAVFDLDGMLVEAYRFNGRWAYGTSAERLSLV